jgi:hypothetical protein
MNNIVREVGSCIKCGYLIDITKELEKDDETENNYRIINIDCPICNSKSCVKIKNNFNIF